MFHHDGTLLARYPHAESMIGRVFKPGPLRLRAQARTGFVSERLISPIDGEDRPHAEPTLEAELGSHHVREHRTADVGNT